MSKDWHLEALCRDDSGDAVYLNVFFPAEYERKDDKIEREDLARQICANCVVRSECLNYALEHEAPSEGIWGGYNKDERRRVLRTKQAS